MPQGRACPERETNAFYSFCANSLEHGTPLLCDKPLDQFQLADFLSSSTVHIVEQKDKTGHGGVYQCEQKGKTSRPNSIL